MDDPMQARNNWGWQATATSIKERTTYLWKKNPIPFNVTLVGPSGHKELIGAHRDILAISSEVFYSMFYGALSKPRDPNDPIVDDDIDPEAFRLMLKFMYTESIGHDDESEDRHGKIEPFPTGVELAFKTMQAAGKYGVPALYFFCRDYILDNIRETFRSPHVAEHGFLYALYARNLEWANKSIIEAVWRDVDEFIEEVLEVSDQVLRTADEIFMVDFLSRCSLNVSNEWTLYHFAVRWARLQQEGPRKNETLKNVMEKLCEVLRFSSFSEQEWRDGPVEDGLYAMHELKNKAAAVGGIGPRCVHNLPAIIEFMMLKAKEKIQVEYERDDNLDDYWPMAIQTQTEDNYILTKLIEKCVRKRMEHNGSTNPAGMDIAFLYKSHVLYDGVDYGDKIRLNKKEMEMLTTGGRPTAEMKLGYGDVAVGFIQTSAYDGKGTLGNMCLIFGDDSGKCHSAFWLGDKTRLFYLGRLISALGFLDRWASSPDPYQRSILYKLTHQKKTLAAPPKYNIYEMVPNSLKYST